MPVTGPLGVARKLARGRSVRASISVDRPVVVPDRQLAPVVAQREARAVALGRDRERATEPAAAFEVPETMTLPSRLLEYSVAPSSENASPRHLPGVAGERLPGARARHVPDDACRGSAPAVIAVLAVRAERRSDDRAVVTSRTGPDRAGVQVEEAHRAVGVADEQRAAVRAQRRRRGAHGPAPQRAQRRGVADHDVPVAGLLVTTRRPSLVTSIVTSPSLTTRPPPSRLPRARVEALRACC